MTNRNRDTEIKLKTNKIRKKILYDHYLSLFLDIG